MTNTKKSNNDIESILGVVAANTMCMRKAISVAAKIGKAWIISGAAIGIAIAVLTSGIKIDMSSSNAWVGFLCYGAIIVFGLFAIIYPLGLLSELDNTTELIAENEQSLLDEDE